MNLVVNGKQQTMDQDGMSVTELLKACDVAQPEMVSVQLNGSFVNREAFGTTTVKEGDEVDFLYFMGGGLVQ